MPSTEDIRRRIEAGIPGASADVTDLTGGGDHFRAVVIAKEFCDMNRIEQHRRVYSIFEGEIGNAIHALSIQTKANSEY
jgi:stress-induced morphogen